MATDLVERELNLVRSAVRAGVHPTTLDRALRAGELRFRWQDGRRLIAASEVDGWVEKRRRRFSIPGAAPVGKSTEGAA